MSMLFHRFYKLRSWRLGTGIRQCGGWMRYWASTTIMKIRIFWATSDRGAFLFFSMLGLALVTLVALIYHAVEGMAVDNDLNCLARNIYYEARGESEKGQRAVAKVTLNRVASSRFPSSICDVVYEKRWDKKRGRYVGAFAWTELDSLPRLKREPWRRAWKAAESVYEKPQSVQLKGALYFHAARIKPKWARQKKWVKRIGRHIFYQ